MPPGPTSQRQPMQRAISTHMLANHHLTAVWLDRIWDAGIPLVEIFCARQHLDYRDKAQVTELGYWFRDAELKLHSLHSPMYSDDAWGRTGGPDAVINIAEPVKSKRLKMVEEIKRALEVAETIPFRYLIQHLGVAGEEFEERKVEAAFSSLEEISLFAGQRGVKVLLENTPNAFSSAQRLLYFFEATHLKLNVCFDLGHAHMNEGVEAAYRLLAPRIRSTHIHDNDAKLDLHLFPFVDPGGSIDWERAMGALGSAPEQYPLLLELRSAPDVVRPVESACRVFEHLERLASKEPARTTEPDPVSPSGVSDGSEGRVGPLRALEELARTTASPLRVSDGSESRIGPVRALEELARTTEPDPASPSRVSDGSEGRVGPVRASKQNDS